MRACNSIVAAVAQLVEHGAIEPDIVWGFTKVVGSSPTRCPYVYSKYCLLRRESCDTDKSLSVPCLDWDNYPLKW